MDPEAWVSMDTTGTVTLTIRAVLLVTKYSASPLHVAPEVQALDAETLVLSSTPG